MCVRVCLRVRIISRQVVAFDFLFGVYAVIPDDAIGERTEVKTDGPRIPAVSIFQKHLRAPGEKFATSWRVMQKAKDLFDTRTNKREGQRYWLFHRSVSMSPNEKPSLTIRVNTPRAHVVRPQNV